MAEVAWLGAPIVLGALMLGYGLYLFGHEEKFDFMAPIIGLFLTIPGAIMTGVQILYLAGAPV
jgi:hypothetical protein